MSDTTIRALEPTDDIDVLTHLIRSAYAAHMAEGLRYWATYQPVDDTRNRLASGFPFVAVRGGALAGTILLRAPQSRSKVELYRDPHTWTFGQFAVLPSLKGHGVGKLLHDHMLRIAVEKGARVMALDTAAPATKLIGLYTSWGYELCGQCDWRPLTNYESVVMRKHLFANK